MTGRQINGKTFRKRRTDRNHIIYLITCLVTGDTYVGITVVRGRAFKKSLHIRWMNHVYHAMVEGRTFPLQKLIRKHGPEAFAHEILKVVRGKETAHVTEKKLIKKLCPTLNVELTSRKRSRWHNRTEC